MPVLGALCRATPAEMMGMWEWGIFRIPNHTCMKLEAFSLRFTPQAPAEAWAVCADPSLFKVKEISDSYISKSVDTEVILIFSFLEMYYLL